MTRTWPTGGPVGSSGLENMAAEGTDSVVLDGTAAEGGGGRVLLAVADVADADGVAGIGGGHRGPDVGAVLHGLAVDLHDEVPGPQPGGVGPAAGLDLGDEGAVPVGADALA